VQHVDTMVEHVDEANQYRRREPVRADALDEFVQVDGAERRISLGTGDEVPALVDVEVAVAPVGDVVGGPRLVDVPSTSRHFSAFSVLSQSAGRLLESRPVMGSPRLFTAANPAYNRRASAILKPFGKPS
jgi:hypothetical protein